MSKNKIILKEKEKIPLKISDENTDEARAA